jgi:hypothetical protein
MYFNAFGGRRHYRPGLELPIDWIGNVHRGSHARERTIFMAAILCKTRLHSENQTYCHQHLFTDRLQSLGVDLNVAVRLFFVLAVFCLTLAAAPPSVAPENIVETYTAVSREQQRVLRGASMEVEIDARLPKLRKQGRLHALRRISALGRITYEALRFEGDNTIKSNVIARYLTADGQAQEPDTPSLAVTPANYKFKYRGLIEQEGRKVYVFQVTPRQKRVGLFRGDLWIDGETYLPVKESGRLVKTPSIFLKKIEFVRTYEIRNGVSVPRSIQSVVETRLVGKAELYIDFTHLSLEDGQIASPIALGEAQ